LSYSVIYLENHKCEVCEKTERNVVEPVAVFVPVGRENLKSELENLNSEQVEQKLKEVYRNIKWYKKESANFKTCIFHCEKENEIWIKNFHNEYEEYAKRRDKAIQEEKPFDEKFEIQWNKDLVNEFWRRIRAYRFAVDYKEKWDEFKGTKEEEWEQLKQLLPKETQKEIEKDKDLILINLENLKKDKFSYDKSSYNFGELVFPILLDYSSISLEEDEEIYIIPENSNFFYSYEKLKFEYYTIFAKSQLHDGVDFSYIQFFSEVNFSFSKFYGQVVFFDCKYHNYADFEGSQFYNEVSFYLSKFYKKAFFNTSQFHDYANFMESQFYNGVSFYLSKFYNLAKFYRTRFYKKAVFNLEGKNLLFDLSAIKLSENSEIEIKNLKTYRLILNNINNTSEHFFFYDTEIITLKDYQKYAKKENIKIDEETLKEVENSPNLEIVNSHLNQMKFINCDFSKANHIKIESSDLTEVKFLATDWGDISKKRICPKMFKNQTKKARDVYRQLKLTLDNHKDYFSANGFYALEMKANLRLLFKNFKENIKKPINYFQNLLIYGSGWLFSNFSQSIFRPLLWILIFTILMTNHLFNWNINIELLINGDFSQLDIKEYLNDFARTLNIFKLFKNEEIIKNNEFWYLIYSIVIATLIYQFIIAVRRRVKR